MKRFAIVLLLLTQAASAQEVLKYSKNFSGLPVTHLARLQVKDTTRRLSEKELHNLCRLFLDAYVISIRKYNQDYLLNRDAPVYRLFQSNFPTIAQREGEGGIFLGEIARYINTLEKYREDLKQSLRSDVGKRKRCKL